MRIAGFLNSRMLLLSVLIISVILENSSYPNSRSLPPPWAAVPRRIRTSRGTALPSGVCKTNFNENPEIDNRDLRVLSPSHQRTVETGPPTAARRWKR